MLYGEHIFLVWWAYGYIGNVVLVQLLFIL